MATILVVDDKPLNRSFLVTLLRYRGHRLLEASDGAEAINLVRTDRPNLVITDILMPKMDGYQLAETIRQDKANSEVKVIFYSAVYIEAEVRALAKGCGVSQIISKPAEPEEILRLVEQTLASDIPITSAPPSTPGQEDGIIKVLSNKLYQKISELEDLNTQLGSLISERTLESPPHVRAGDHGNYSSRR